MQIIMPIPTRIVVLLFFVFAAALALANTCVQAASLGPGDHTITLKHGGRERSAIAHVPPRASEKAQLPVLLNFHGGGGHGANEQQYSLMDGLAGREIFIAVYPNGTGRFEKRLLTWNAGSCCAYAAVNNIDDVGFVRALIAELSLSLPINRRRVYATGLSNGGMMAHRLAGGDERFDRRRGAGGGRHGAAGDQGGAGDFRHALP
jgi:polyhydroxybutyrate depolymerase